MPAVPAPPTFANPMVLNDTDLNALAAAIRFALAPPQADLIQTVAQTLTTGAFTALTFNAATFDVDVDGVGGHDPAVNNSRYTARYPGRYLVAPAGAFVAIAAGQRFVELKVNGSDVNGSGSELDATASSSCLLPGRGKIVYLNVGDYVEAYVFQNSGGNVNTAVFFYEQSTMDVLWVGN